MSADNEQIKVSGHLESKRGIFQIILNWKIDGKRHRKSISTGLPIKGNKKRADAMLYEERKKMEERIQDGMKEYSTNEVLVSQILFIWLDSVESELKPTTYGNHQNLIERIIAPYFDAKKITVNALTPDDITLFYEERMKTVKATTIHKYHNILSRALKYAVDKDIIDINPIKKVKRPKAERFVGKFLKESEVKNLFEAVKGHKLELGVILGAYYGLRRAEVVGLRWESINFEQNTITIEHSVTVARVKGKKKIIESDTVKSESSYRTLPLVPKFRSKLLALKDEQAANKKLFKSDYTNTYEDYIYVDQLGKRIRPDYLTTEFPKFLEANGFRRMRFHDTRHSCASLLLANGVSLKEIQEWLGHSYFAITANTYAHLDFSAKLKAAKAMTWIDDTTLDET